MNIEENKKAAVDFLNMIIAGKIDDAYEKYIDMNGKHHNVSTPAGLAALKEGMEGAGNKFPDKQFVIQHVVAEGDLVVVHSHLTLEPGTIDFAAVHLLRFANGKIVEFWDIAQDIDAKNSINTDGAF
jgi:predicted SnoaL-like aldol condensation-catalyzing enzyme